MWSERGWLERWGLCVAVVAARMFLGYGDSWLCWRSIFVVGVDAFSEGEERWVLAFSCLFCSTSAEDEGSPVFVVAQRAVDGETLPVFVVTGKRHRYLHSRAAIHTHWQAHLVDFLVAFMKRKQSIFLLFTWNDGYLPFPHQDTATIHMLNRKHS